jgi:signal transduction histidine kinase
MAPNESDPLIVYVDDVWANRVVFDATFGKRFRILSVESGQAALEAFSREPIAVLVSDQRMPGMTGMELLKQVKQSHPDTIRMILTAYGDLDPILRAVNEGLVARYVVKPWDGPELEKILAWGIEAYRLGLASSELQIRLLQNERLATLGTFAASVMHDLKQPLAFVRYNVDRLGQLQVSAPALGELVERQGATLAVADRTNLGDLATELPEIVDETRTGLALANGILGGMSQMMRPADEPSGEISEPAEPVLAIQLALSFLRTQAMMARARLAYEGPERLPSVKMGRTELMQVLLNVLGNAVQAIGRQGRAGRVAVSAAAQEAEVCFSIADDGPGMSAEVLARVGTPFFSARPGGTGLGVSQCRRLVGAAGGRFDITSGEGKGTTIAFSLPIAG